MPSDPLQSLGCLHLNPKQTTGPHEHSATPRRIQVQRRAVPPSRDEPLMNEGSRSFLTRVEEQGPVVESSIAPPRSWDGIEAVHSTAAPLMQRGAFTSFVHCAGRAQQQQDVVVVHSPVKFPAGSTNGFSADYYPYHDVEAESGYESPRKVKRMLPWTFIDPTVSNAGPALAQLEHRSQRCWSLNSSLPSMSLLDESSHFWKAAPIDTISPPGSHPQFQRGTSGARSAAVMGASAENSGLPAALAQHRSRRSRSLNSSLHPSSSMMQLDDADTMNSMTPLPTALPSASIGRRSRSLNSTVRSPQAVRQGHDSLVEQHLTPADRCQHWSDRYQNNLIDGLSPATSQRGRLIGVHSPRLGMSRCVEGSWSNAAFPAPMEGFLTLGLDRWPSCPGSPLSTPRRPTPMPRIHSPLPGGHSKLHCHSPALMRQGPERRSHSSPVAAQHSASPPLTGLSLATTARGLEYPSTPVRARSSSPGHHQAALLVSPRTFPATEKRKQLNPSMGGFPRSTSPRPPRVSSTGRDRPTAPADVSLLRNVQPHQLVSKATQTEKVAKQGTHSRGHARAPPGRGQAADTMPGSPGQPLALKKSRPALTEPLAPLSDAVLLSPPKPDSVARQHRQYHEMQLRDQSPPPYQPVSEQLHTAPPHKSHPPPPASSTAGWSSEPQSFKKANAGCHTNFPVVRPGRSPARRESTEQMNVAAQTSRLRQGTWYQPTGVKVPCNPDGSLWFPQVHSTTLNWAPTVQATPGSAGFQGQRMGFDPLSMMSPPEEL
eukprot:GGOE01062268.1.p1 GENE.GGOE01062268.1~~GGOE01062268.1.p1  ORF type:complete len:770 (+),score=-7.64 GGOE01062268.1:54-2363(+)